MRSQRSCSDASWRLRRLAPRTRSDVFESTTIHLCRTWSETAAFAPHAACAQLFGWITQHVGQLGDEFRKDLEHMSEEAREEAAFLIGAESYVFGYPLVIMDVTRRMLTAVARPNVDGTTAPINQFARMPHYVSPDFKNVVRISGPQDSSTWITNRLCFHCQIRPAGTTCSR
jgi:hypothetical protein